MKREEEQAVRERFQTALELFDLAERMLETRLRREHPEWTEDQIDEAVDAWLSHRPGAEHGDGEGRPVPLPRPE